MSATPAAAVRTQNRSLTIVILAALALMALWFIATRALRYADYSHGTYGDYYWPRRWVLIPHILGGITAVTTGIVQLWLGLTNRVSRLHRVLGKVYVAGVFIGSLGGFILALTIPPKDVVYAMGLFMLCTAWVIT